MDVPSQVGPDRSAETRVRGLPASTLRSSLLGRPSVLTRRSLPSSSLLLSASLRAAPPAGSTPEPGRAATWIQEMAGRGERTARSAEYLVESPHAGTATEVIRGAVPADVRAEAAARARTAATEVVEARRSGGRHARQEPGLPRRPGGRAPRRGTAPRQPGRVT